MLLKTGSIIPQPISIMSSIQQMLLYAYYVMSSILNSDWVADIINALFHYGRLKKRVFYKQGGGQGYSPEIGVGR